MKYKCKTGEGEVRDISVKFSSGARSSLSQHVRKEIEMVFEEFLNVSDLCRELQEESWIVSYGSYKQLNRYKPLNLFHNTIFTC